jgi:prepilin-type N-terminal cleavage/methylation domain-containing protein
MTRDRSLQRGFTMLEVLVALLILLIGLLGLAGLLVTTQQGEVEAYQRKQAAVLLQDMIDRLTANPKAAGAACGIGRDCVRAASRSKRAGEPISPHGTTPCWGLPRERAPPKSAPSSTPAAALRILLLRFTR